MRRKIMAVVWALLALFLVQAAIGIFVYYDTVSTKELHDVALGQCYRVNFLRYEIDLARVERWRADRANGLKGVAKAEAFLPFTNCEQATDHPTSYRPPGPVQVTPQNISHIEAEVRHPLGPPG